MPTHLRAYTVGEPLDITTHTGKPEFLPTRTFIPGLESFDRLELHPDGTFEADGKVHRVDVAITVEPFHEHPPEPVRYCHICGQQTVLIDRTVIRHHTKDGSVYRTGFVHFRCPDWEAYMNHTDDPMSWKEFTGTYSPPYVFREPRPRHTARLLLFFFVVAAFLTGLAVVLSTLLKGVS